MARLSEYLPSKQFQAVALSVVGAFALVVFASKLADNPNVVPEEQRDFEANISTSTLVAITQKIIENNSDWESVIASSTLIKNVSSNSTNTPLTATDIVARDLFAKYLAVKQGGGKLDQKTEEELIQSVLTSTDLTPRYRMYTEGEILIGTDNSTSSLKEYGNKMGEIIKNNSIKNTSDLNLVQNALNKNDKKQLGELDKKIASNKNLISSALLVSVPPSAKKIHLQFINSSSEIESELSGLKNVFDDPVSAIFAVSNYLNTANKARDSLQNIKNFFNSMGITYSKNEPGFLFINQI